MTTATVTSPESTTEVESHQGVKVGDFFYASWGYDQTNIDWWKVVGFTKSGKSVRIQKWQGAVSREGSPQDTVVPGEGPVTGAWVRNAEGFREYMPKIEAPIETKVIKSYNGRAVLAWESFASMYQWDGKPKWQTGTGYGH